MKLRIDNVYSDGHESSREVVLDDEPSFEEVTDEDSEWWDDEVFAYTGDGHGTDPGVGSCYTATIIAARDERLVGLEYEWV